MNKTLALVAGAAMFVATAATPAFATNHNYSHTPTTTNTAVVTNNVTTTTSTGGNLTVGGSSYGYGKGGVTASNTGNAASVTVVGTGANLGTSTGTNTAVVNNTVTSKTTTGGNVTLGGKGGTFSNTGNAASETVVANVVNASF